MNHSNPRTVLIVEDDEGFNYAVARALREAGHSVITVTGSMDALREMDKGAVDVAVIDVVLKPKEPHGISLGHMIKSKRPSTSVLFVTARDDLTEDQFPGEVLYKPVQLDELTWKVGDLLTKQRSAI
jgi:DNA-binding response OmpR family regulator